MFEVAAFHIYYMVSKVKITVQDFKKQSHIIEYVLSNNPIAYTWYRKIYHLHRVPLSKQYTSVRHKEPIIQINAQITNYLLQLKETVGLNYTIKESYDQTDCNRLHSITLSTQYNYSPEVREIFHTMHRAIHKLEHHILNIVDNSIHIGWGENEGPVESKFELLPYQWYENVQVGNIYLSWSEFGKTPYQYWKNHEIDNQEHFFKTCKPHKTFRALFALILEEHKQQFSDGFDQWFDQYRIEWELKYGCGWLPLYEWGGVPLGYPTREFDWSTVNTVLAIQPA